MSFSIRKPGRKAPGSSSRRSLGFDLIGNLGKISSWCSFPFEYDGDVREIPRFA